MKVLSTLFFVAILILQSCDSEPKEQVAQEEEVVEQSETNFTTASGLQVEILSEGQGTNPKTGDIVSVHYTGTLKSNGEVFDSSTGRDPYQFALGRGQVIRGWDEGIALLKEGTKAVLTIPASLGYGSQAKGPIPANSDLVFEVQLVSVKPAPAPVLHDVFETEGLEMQITSTGLKYYIIEEGDGPEIEKGSNVIVHYYGYLPATDKKFDSSFERGEPIELTVGVGQVIPGWDEGLSLFREGTKAKLIIPSELAYGAQGRGGIIPPNAELAFDMQIMKVK